MHRRLHHGLGSARIVFLLVLTYAAAPAWASCVAFFARVSDVAMENSRAQVVIVREFDFTTMTLQFNYRGDPDEFTLVFPVPVVLTDQDVRVVDRGLIERLDTFTAPRAVRFFRGGRRGGGTARRDGGSEDAGAPDDVVRIEAEFAAGEYQIVILSATESTGLFDWLGREGFMLPEKAVPILQHYIDQGMFFLAARVTLDPQARDDFSFLSPLQMSFATRMFSLPVLMGTINAADEQDLVVYAIARDAEVRISNYPSQRLKLGTQYQPGDWSSFNQFVDAQFESSRILAEVDPPETIRRPPPPSSPPRAVAVIEYVGPVHTANPPTTDPITWVELRMLGFRGSTFPYVTRLHLRYTSDQVPEDLIFYEFPPTFFTPNFVRLPLRGDFDLDDDVDLADFLAIDACLRGAGRFPLFSECYRFDLDQDGDIDLADLLRFQASFTGSR